jgi:hypothetical protein
MSKYQLFEKCDRFFGHTFFTKMVSRKGSQNFERRAKISIMFFCRKVDKKLSTFFDKNMFATSSLTSDVSQLVTEKFCKLSSVDSRRLWATPFATLRKVSKKGSRVYSTPKCLVKRATRKCLKKREKGMYAFYIPRIDENRGPSTPF